jgi:hypothetical protein
MRKGLIMLSIFLCAGVSACSSEDSLSNDSSDCDIKGNISYNTGEKIYHLPGDQFYDVTEINGSYGEGWFCSPEEAEDEGFRRSLR